MTGKFTDLLFEQQDARRYVFHYTKAETALRHILPSLTIRLSPMAALNDPRESRLLGFTYLPEDLGHNPNNLTGSALLEQFETIREHRPLIDEISRLLSRRIKVACFCRDNLPISTDDPGYYRGYSRPSMWAHYAGNHTGICLVFERERLVSSATRQLSKAGQLRFGNVRYAKTTTGLRDFSAFNVKPERVYEVGTDTYVQELFRSSYSTYRLKKHPDWRAESEWRLNCYGPDERPEFIDVSDALCGVVIGLDASQATLSTLDHWITSHPLPAIKLAPHNLTGRGYSSVQFLPPIKSGVFGDD